MSVHSKARQNILSRIRKALTVPTPMPFPEVDLSAPIYAAPADDLSVVFAERFTSLGGHFAYCPQPADLIQVLRSLIEDKKWKDVYVPGPRLRLFLETHGWNEWSAQPVSECHAAITTCDLLVARTGSMVLSSALEGGRIASVYAPVHICLATTSQLVGDTADAVRQLKDDYGDQLPSMISFAAGPSRTADIEKTLVVGVHGPGEVYCFLLEGDDMAKPW